MKTPKVRLYIRVRLSDGRYAFLDPVWNRNQTLRAGYALVEGKPEYHPEGLYYLRFLRDGKRVWHPVGKDVDVAITLLRNTEHDFRSVALGRALPTVVTISLEPVSQDLSVSKTKASEGVSLKGAVETYLAEVRRFRAPKTIAACEHMLNLFGSRFANKAIKQLTREDLLDHISFLRAEGLEDHLPLER